MHRKSIRLSPRLERVLTLLGDHPVIADIGCDHGRLSAALLQRGHAGRVIAVDVGEAPLRRAAALARLCGLARRMETRLGDGFAPIQAGEIQAAAIAGMGGDLMIRLLQAAPIPLMGADLCVFQPMRGAESLRHWLFMNGYRILEDEIVRDGGRLYQVFSAGPGQEPPFLAGWPEGCFSMGPGALHDPLFPVLAEQMLAQHERRLLTAAGTAGEAALKRKATHMQSLLALWETFATIGKP